MVLIETSIEGLYTSNNVRHEDDRGSFTRFFCRDEFSAFLGDKSIKQINHSVTNLRGTVRGLHYQIAPFSEAKLIRCLKGNVFDVAVDLREDSPTFLNWHAEILTPSSNKLFLLPEGFAHGFQALEDNCELLYLHTMEYQPKYERGLSYKDKQIGIKWPLPTTCVSDRDKLLPTVSSLNEDVAV